MGLLPHRFPGRPERRDIDLYALIEPARMVGGDLYDFLLLDAQRLFFAIADVSGGALPVIATDCGGKPLEAPRLVVPGDNHAGRAVRGVVTIDVR